MNKKYVALAWVRKKKSVPFIILGGGSVQICKKGRHLNCTEELCSMEYFLNRPVDILSFNN